MSRKSILILVASLSIILVGASVVVIRNRKNDDIHSTGRIIRSVESGMSVTVNPDLQQRAVGGSERQKGKLWAFEQPAGTRPEFSITAVYSEDPTIKKLASVTNKLTTEAVLDNVTRQLQKQYDQHDYDFRSKNTFSINGYDAAEVVFEYTSSSKVVRQRVVLVFRNQTSVVYIRGQAETTAYDMMNAKYLEPLLASVKFD